MSKPKPNRCEICDRVTSRYSHTERAGAIVLKVWVRDPLNGEVKAPGGKFLCKECAS